MHYQSYQNAEIAQNLSLIKLEFPLSFYARNCTRYAVYRRLQYLPPNSQSYRSQLQLIQLVMKVFERYTCLYRPTLGHLGRATCPVCTQLGRIKCKSSEKLTVLIYILWLAVSSCVLGIKIYYYVVSVNSNFTTKRHSLNH